jgi:opacity protein-like surface antigen
MPATWRLTVAVFLTLVVGGPGASRRAAAAEPDFLRLAPSPPEFYLASVVGGAFATMSQPELPPGSPAIGTQSLLTGGLAAGLEWERPSGAVRLELEGQARERMAFSDTEPLIGTLLQGGDDGWSALANIWRDITITERLDAYLGGGIGAGGYRYFFAGDSPGAVISGSTDIATFAWQAGGGVAFAFSDRITLDVGYRFLGFAAAPATIVVTTPVETIRDSVSTQYSSGQFLIMLRIYEPFRGFR